MNNDTLKIGGASGYWGDASLTEQLFNMILTLSSMIIWLK